jgi:hypothetical protein
LEFFGICIFLTLHLYQDASALPSLASLPDLPGWKDFHSRRQSAHFSAPYTL